MLKYCVVLLFVWNSFEMAIVGVRLEYKTLKKGFDCWGWRVIAIFDGGLLRDSLDRFIGCSLKGSYQRNACNYACQTWICDFSPILTKSRQKQIQNRNINLNQIFSVFHLKLSKNKQHRERTNPYLWHLTNYQVHSKLSKKMGEMF